MILEELLLGDVHLHPYELLGWEGLFGTLFMLCISLPVVGIIPGSCLSSTPCVCLEDKFAKRCS